MKPRDDRRSCWRRERPAAKAERRGRQRTATVATRGRPAMNGNARSPFLDVQSFLDEEMEAARPIPAGVPAWSPFLSVYEAANGASHADHPLREAYATLVNDLYDEEFDETLFEL